MTIISHVLPRLAVSFTPEKRKIKRRPETGYKLSRTTRSAAHCLLSDQQVAEARWMVDYGGWTHKQVQSHYRLSYSYTARLLNGTVRSRVRTHRKDDFPIGYSPAPLPAETETEAA